MHTIHKNVQVLQSLAEMDRQGNFYYYAYDLIIHEYSGISILATRFRGHLFSNWKLKIGSLFNKGEIRPLHSQFGHSKAEELYNLLNRRELSNLFCKTPRMSENTTRHFHLCRIYAASPRRSIYTLRDEKELN